MSEENKALTRRFYDEVFNKKRPAAFDEFCDPHFLDHNPEPGQAPGLEGVRQSLATFFKAFPDMRLTVEDMIAEGDKVVSRVSVRGTHTGEFQGLAPTHKPVTVSGIDIVRIEGGKAVERWGSFDMLGLMQQLGVGGPPG
jgi:predicted ester cyclase